MDKNTVIRLAREAGWTCYDSQDERFERFATLVAAAEREECARICDKHWDDNGQHCANAIRRRTYDER